MLAEEFEEEFKSFEEDRGNYIKKELEMVHKNLSIA